MSRRTNVNVLTKPLTAAGVQLAHRGVQRRGRTNRLATLVVTTIAACPLSGAVAASNEGELAGRPNFVIILTDDMGYSDPGCYGGEIATPNIDRLAAGGIRFTQFYNCSRCCPTRASMLTGAYAQRIGMDEFGRTMDIHVPTIAERLRAAGYQTALDGKWHLSELPSTDDEAERIKWMDHRIDLPIPLADPASLPTRRGFDRFYGIVWGVVDHFDPFSLCENEEPIRNVPDNFYLTDAISDRAVADVLDFARSEQPFFLYVAYTAPHWPIHARPEDITKYRGKYAGGWDELRRQRFARQIELGLFDKSMPLGEVITQGPRWRRLPGERRAYLAAKMEVHAAMVDRVDQGVGEILAALRDTAELENTIVMFLSDNGASPEIPGPPGYDRNSGTRDGRPALREADLQRDGNVAKLGSEESYTGIGAPWASAVNTPLRYWKMESYEGGCRTPLVIHWPAGLKASAGGILHDVGHVIDIAPTCLELAGVSAEGEFKMDGVSLAPILAGQPLDVDRALFFSHFQGRGVRRGPWKASKLGSRGWELFNLDEDPGETQDLSGEHPEELNRLVRELTDWRRAMSESESDDAAEQSAVGRASAAEAGP
jgi:arylsulfatase